LAKSGEMGIFVLAVWLFRRTFLFAWLTNPSPKGSPSLCQGTHIERVPVVLLDKGGGSEAEGGFVSQSGEIFWKNQ